MAPGKKDLQEENMLMGLIPLEKRESGTRNLVCVFRNATTIDWKSNKIVQNLPDDTTIMQLYKIAAEKVNYLVQSISLVFLKPSCDGKSDEETVLDSESNSTLAEVLGKTKAKVNNFMIKGKNGKNPVKRIQQPTENTDMSDGNSYAGISNLFDNETSFSRTYSNSDDRKGVSFSKSESGFVGLINQAMTCYLNSLLQTLFMTPEFRNALYRWKFLGTKEEASKSIPFQLQKLFLKLQTSKKKAVETTDLTKSFGWDSSEAWQQHDVQELCRVMFDALEETLKNTDQANMINQLYQGKIKDYVKCLQCSHESARNDTYLDIPLPIRPFGSKDSYSSIEEAFEAFTTPEILDGNNQYFCEKCNVKQDAHKGLKFLTFPYLLTIQLKRFSFDYKTGQRIKLHDKITFPDTIRLNDFLHIDEPKKLRSNSKPSKKSPVLQENVVNGSEADGDNHEERGAKETQCSLQKENDVDRSSEIYELFSIMIHSGNALGGHYYAYIKSFADDKWYCFNDQHVYEITKKEIEKSYGGLDTSARGYYSATYSSSTNAYMLMYRKKDVGRNAMFEDLASWPDHVTSLSEKLEGEEDDEINKKAKEKYICKIRLFCSHPTTKKWIETKLHVDQSKTLKETTEIAWKVLGVNECIELERCRIVKYDDYYGSFESSYEGEEEKQIGVILGGVKYSYAFDLLLETRSYDEKFPVYEIGGTTVKVHHADLEKMEVKQLTVLHAKSDYSLLDLKTAIEKELGFSTQSIRIAVGKDSNDFRLLTESMKSLKAEGFYKSAKVYIETSGGPDSSKIFAESDFAKVLDKYSNTISLIVVLPFNNLQTKEPKEIIIQIDKRNTLADLKKLLAPHVGADCDDFRVYRVYSNNQEFETTRLSEQLVGYNNEARVIIKLGKALKPGETRIKIYFLRPNEEEHTKFLMETVASEGVKVKDLKYGVMEELKKSFDIQAQSECIRLRKKSWKSPGKIYTDEMEFEKDIKLAVNTEFFAEIVDEGKEVNPLTGLSLYVKRWRPSEYTIDQFQEIFLEDHSIKNLKSKLSELSGLAENDIDIAKGKGYFPYESSVFDIERELDWGPDVSHLNEYPIAISDDGSVIYYKDKNEELGDVSDEKKKEIKEKERKRIVPYDPKSK